MALILEVLEVLPLPHYRYRYSKFTHRRVTKGPHGIGIMSPEEIVGSERAARFLGLSALLVGDYILSQGSLSCVAGCKTGCLGLRLLLRLTLCLWRHLIMGKTFGSSCWLGQWFERFHRWHELQELALMDLLKHAKT
jgi:hypothetical protein